MSPCHSCTKLNLIYILINQLPNLNRHADSDDKQHACAQKAKGTVRSMHQMLPVKPRITLYFDTK